MRCFCCKGEQGGEVLGQEGHPGSGSVVPSLNVHKREP